jgi:hypothetical protein
VLLLGLVALAGCGASAAEVRSAGTDPSTTAASTTTSTVPSLPADLVVWRESTGGGFVPIQVNAGDYAEVTILGDGTAYVADDAADRPYDAPTPVLRGRADPAALAAFLADARRSGLFEADVDLGSPGVTDMPSTAVELADGHTSSGVSAYALSFSDDGLTTAQAARRKELRDLIARARRLITDTEPFIPERVRATVFGADQASTSDGAEPTPWPGRPFADLPIGPEGGEACLALEGDEARSVWEAAVAGETSVWARDGEVRQIVVAPLLPGDDGCDG